jgi:hypothetical protein
MLLRIRAIAVALVLCAAPVLAQTINVGSVSDSRGASGWTLDGTNQSQARLKLLNAANFGPGGTVASPIAITDVAVPITAGTFTGLNVFYIGYFANGTFAAGELSALQAWVNGGGTVITTCDDGSHADVCSAFGHTTTTQATSPTVPTVAGASHPIFAGPFGAVASVNMAFTQGYFTTTTGATVLGQDSSGSNFPTVMIQTVGAGRVIFLSDVDMIANASSSALSTGAGISNGNDRFLANLFAFAGNGTASAPAANLPVPALDTFALVALALLLTALAAWRLRKR